MRRSLIIVALAVGAGGMAAPAEAFWPRTQLQACSAVANEADFQRWRCWELDGQVPMSFGPPAIVPYPGGVGQDWRRLPQRQGPVVRRLG
jgi:hypothetical protein